MLPCQTTCRAYCEGCHKTCQYWRLLQQCQYRERQRKKEYLRRADETCRQVLHSFRQAGGYIGPQPGH